jgi:formylglycine-generating enzyme required for sulfatase activity
MGSDPSYYFNGIYFIGTNHPVQNVSWDDCQTFISKLNSLTGEHFRLPTEAEWEYAARGGNQSKGYKYSGSNNIGDVAWNGNNSGSKTHGVATRAPNELGIYDMSGNVAEWCQDWYGDRYYYSSPIANPTGPDSGSGRVFRGGSWGSNPGDCGVADRRSYTPDTRYYSLGLRLAL